VKSLYREWTVIGFDTYDGGPLRTERFPFEEIAQFHTIPEAVKAGWQVSQIWSVTEGDDDDVWVYGPSRHHVNLLHYIVTNEHHNENSYAEVHS
jgi:hypothetical protein